MNRPIKVMLIDDDPGIHESLRAVVEEAGYESAELLAAERGFDCWMTSTLICCFST